MNSNQKKCHKCTQVKPIEEFYVFKKYTVCKVCHNKTATEWKKKNPLATKLIVWKYQAKLKNEVLSVYGRNGKPECVQCGFSDIRALCLDHINDNGAEERLKLGSKNIAGTRFATWVRKQGFPKGYQTLCANCNLIKEIERRRNGHNNTIPT